jgi:hypothetical protein
MSEALASAKQFHVKQDREGVRHAILAALPKDAIVRSEDDAVGRFAGERIVVLDGRQHEKLMLLRGSYGTIKRRLEDPDVQVRFESTPEGTRVDIAVRVEASKPVQEITGSLVSNFVSVAILIFAVNYYRGAETDPLQAGLIALGIAVVATFIGRRYSGPTAAESLVTLIEAAVEPLSPQLIAASTTDE